MAREGTGTLACECSGSSARGEQSLSKARAGGGSGRCKELTALARREMGWAGACSRCFLPFLCCSQQYPQKSALEHCPGLPGGVQSPTVHCGEGPVTQCCGGPGRGLHLGLPAHLFQALCPHLRCTLRSGVRAVMPTRSPGSPSLATVNLISTSTRMLLVDIP